MKGVERGGSVDIKCLSVSGDGLMMWRRTSDPPTASVAATLLCFEV